MSFLSRVRIATHNLFHRDRVERDLDAEVHSYSDLLEDEKISTGMNASDARRSARMHLGGPEQLKEEIRAVRAGAWLGSLSQDVRFGVRMLRKNPGFTAVAVLTLALGIGANTAIFSVIESQLWRPLPFPDSERVYQVDSTPLDNSTRWFGVSGPELSEWRMQARSFDVLGGFGDPVGRNFSSGANTGRAISLAITSGFFEALQIHPALGRAFKPEDEIAGNDSASPSHLLMEATPQRIAILSHHLWRDAFNSDAAAIGKFVILDGIPYTIVGIAPAGLQLEFTLDPDLFVPLRVDIATHSRLSNDNFSVVGHLARGVTPEHARAEMDSMIARQVATAGSHAQPRRLMFQKLRIAQTSYASGSLFFFGGATAFVLLIACVNIAGLLLARGLTRQREFTLRAVLGATPGVIMRQLLVESMLIALMGGAAGTLLSVWSARAFVSLVSTNLLPRVVSADPDLRVLFFTISVCVISAAIVGLFPALLASRADANGVLRQGGRSVTQGRSQRRIRVALLIAEVSLALVLLFGAGLFLGSFIKQQQAPLGFDPHGILTADIMLRGASYVTPDQQRLFYNRVATSTQALPGIRAVAISTSVPLEGGGQKSFTIPGRPDPAPGEEPHANVCSMSPDFLDLFQMRLLSGRNFTERDSPNSARVAIVNRNFARHYFPNDDPIGKVLSLMAGGYGQIIVPGQVQIVGLVENAQEFGANEIPSDNLYLPYAQSPAGKAILSVGSDLPVATLMSSIRHIVQGIDKDQPVYNEQTMDDFVRESLRGAQTNLILVALLAVVATLLVSIGIFGTISHFVQQLTQEFGIRLALGASPVRLLRHTLAQTLTICFSGLLLGIAISLGLGRLLRSALYLVPHEHTGMLYGVSIYDPLAVAAASALIIAVVLLASYIPARRAMKVDPMVALRHE
jgi:putative ABC transport system permease protein